jgi:hypothetical protein
MSRSSRPPEPWDSFFQEIDSAIEEQVRLDCMGGFVITQLYGLDRATADIDVFGLGPKKPAEIVIRLGQLGGPLNQKYKVYIDCNAFVAPVLENYEDRLLEMFQNRYEHLRLMAFESYDLALSKLERNSQKDRDDVRYLAKTVPFDLGLLKERYQTEMRWQMAQPGREDLTLELWLEMILEDRGELAEDEKNPE